MKTPLVVALVTASILSTPAQAFQVLFHTGEPANVSQIDAPTNSWRYSRTNCDGIYLIHATFATLSLGHGMGIVDSFRPDLYSNAIVEVPYAQGTLDNPPRHVRVLDRLGVSPIFQNWYDANRNLGNGLGAALTTNEYANVQAVYPDADLMIHMRGWNSTNQQRVIDVNPAGLVFEFSVTSSAAKLTELANGTKWLLDNGYKVVWLLAPGDSNTDPSDPADPGSYLRGVVDALEIMSLTTGRATRMRSAHLYVCPGGYAPNGIDLIPELVTVDGLTRAANTVSGAVRQCLLRRTTWEAR